jgi:antitoxin Phd
MKAWQLQEAKAKFSEVVEAALQDGPQAVTRRGEQAVVIVSYEAFVALTQANTSLDDALAGAPEELVIERDKTPVPSITLG